MRRSIVFLSFFFMLACISCQKDNFTFDKSVANFTKVIVTGVERNDDDNAEEFPYRISYTVVATLSDISDVEEWGVYFTENSEPIEFAFKQVSRNETIYLYLNTISSMLHVGETISYIEVNRKIGLYIKKRGKNGVVKTYYSEMTEFLLRYDFPSVPSVEYSNAKIVSLEEVEEDGVAKYKTTYSYDITVKGSFWIDHLEDVLSSGWHWEKESNYFYLDGTYSRTHTSTYRPMNVQFSQWVVIHLCDSEQTIESKNWINISGNPSISKVEVSDTERNI